MSQIQTGTLVETPELLNRSGNTVPNVVVTLDATGETLHMSGAIYFADGYSSTAKTLSAAGSGKIIWLTNTVTFANAGSTFKVGLQDLSTASSPCQGDGTFDVYAEFTGGGGGISSAATNTSTMTSGTKTISWGQEIAISFEFTARAGADSITVNTVAPHRRGANFSLPMCSDNTSGSYARTANTAPMAILQFDDGSLGFIIGTIFYSAVGSVSYALDTGTADEYCNIITFSTPRRIIGAAVNSLLVTSQAVDAEIILYSDPLGTPVAERTYIYDGTIAPTFTQSGEKLIMFSSPYNVNPNTPIALSVRATVNGQSVRIYYIDEPTLAIANAFCYGDWCYAGSRLDNTGPFADYNGGTAKTRHFGFAVISDTIGQDSTFATSTIGI